MRSKKYMVGLLIIVAVMAGLWLAGYTDQTEQDESFVCGQDPMIGPDSKEYPTVKIGDQCWSAEHLKTTLFSDGTPIAQPLENDDWRRAGLERQGAYACYNNDPENCETYGALYNIFAVDRGLCPANWRVPSDEDWKELEIALGMSRSDADKLYWRGAPIGIELAGHYELWDEDGFRDRSEFGRTGFNAEPAGYRMSNGRYSWLGHRANLWSSTIRASGWRRTIISSSSGGVRRTAAAKNFGFSVRCIQE